MNCVSRAMVVGATFAFALGCDKREEIRQQQTPKDPAYAAVADVAMPIRADVPEGWTQTRDDEGVTEFRIGSAAQAARVVISPIDRDIFEQTRLQNINRWRKMVGLQEVQQVNADEIKKARIAGMDGSAIDLLGPEARTIIIWCAVGGKMWFVRIEGPTESVNAQKPRFDKFLESVRFPGQNQ